MIRVLSRALFDGHPVTVQRSYLMIISALS